MKRWVVILLFLTIASYLSAQVWQWSVPVTAWISEETGTHPQTFLWIPEDCEQVRAIVVGMHNMCEENIFEHPEFRATMAELGFALVWISPIIDYQWKVESGCQKAFDRMMSDLADASGYSELKTAPVVPLGHSAMATFPWNFAAWNGERTLAVISYKGDAPRTNLCGYGRENLEWGRTRNIDGIPGLMIKGEYEWWEARVNPALAFRMMYPESCISFLADAGHGHFDVSDEVVEYICLFLKKAAAYRLPSMQPLNPRDGWLAERWRPGQKSRAKPAPAARYKGDPHDAFWYFDREVAEATEKYYARRYNKAAHYIGFEQNGQLLEYVEDSHEGYNGVFRPEADGLTFHLKAVFTDSLRKRITSGEKVAIDRICGAVRKISDSVFTVRFYRMGLNNHRRTGDIWLMAYTGGDKRHKSAVQQINIKIPYPAKEGKPQSITFPEMENVKIGATPAALRATSDSGLPVYYYVREGAAEIIGRNVVLTKIPPRAKLPHKVTIVAWQYGIAGKIQTAEAVEQSFEIEE
jgi:hypothetical protein